MSDNSESPMTEETTPSVFQSPGFLVKAQREAAGLSYQTVGDGLHLTVHYIKALENDDYNKLPGMTFVKGYFRSYAKFLGMDVEHVLDSYEGYLAQQGLVSTTSAFAARPGRSKSDQAMIWALVAGFILVIALVAGWWFFGRPAETRTTTINQPATSRTTAVSNSRQGFNAPAINTPNRNAIISSPATPVTDAAPAMPVLESNPAGLSAGDLAMSQTGVVAESATETAQAALDNSNVAPANEAGEAAASNQDSANSELEATLTTPAGADSANSSASGNADSAAPLLAAAGTVTTDSTGVEYLRTEAGNRLIRLLGEGSDQLEISANGPSWAEIEDAQRISLFNDLLRSGDTLAIQGRAPFYILLGDARQVAVKFNAGSMAIDELVRPDNTARFELSASGVASAVNTN